MSLSSEMPKLAAEIKRGFIAMGETELAESVDGPEVVSRCECGEPNCGTFNLLPKATWGGKPELDQITPDIDGLCAIDIIRNRIASVEFLGRSDVVEYLDAKFGSPTTT